MPESGTQPWYADGVRALFMFNKIGLYFNLLKQFILCCVYYPEPSKSVLIVNLDNITAMKQFGLRHRFQVYTGVHYLGGFIEYDKSKRDYLKYRTLKWEKNICAITENVGKYIRDS